MSLSFTESSILVESKQIKGTDIIRLQPIGTRRETCIKFEVLCFTCYIISCILVLLVAVGAPDVV